MKNFIRVGLLSVLLTLATFSTMPLAHAETGCACAPCDCGSACPCP